MRPAQGAAFGAGGFVRIAQAGLFSLLVVGLISFAARCNADDAGSTSRSPAEPARLVRVALEAEAAGDSQARSRYLAQALAADPDYLAGPLAVRRDPSRQRMGCADRTYARREVACVPSTSTATYATVRKILPKTTKRSRNSRPKPGCVNKRGSMSKAFIACQRTKPRSAHPCNLCPTKGVLSPLRKGPRER